MSLKLTCVTATFNVLAGGNREQLIRCVRSVASLKVDHEHLIYDGASTDGTVELLMQLAKDIPNLRVVSEKDSGIYNALNKGVRDARGEWFYVLGCDDYICHPKVLDELMTTVGRDKEVIVSPVERETPSFYHRLLDLRHAIRKMTYGHQGMIVRTETVRRLGGFNEKYRYAADWDFMLRVHAACCQMLYTTTPYAFFSAGGTSDVSRAASKAEAEGIHRAFLKLTEREEELFNQDGRLPLHAIRPYLLHRDGAFRFSAWYCVLRWLCQPIVCAILRRK